MNNHEVTEFKPLPGKEETDYGSFRIRLLNVRTISDGKQRSVVMDYVNVGTGRSFSRGYNTTDRVDKFGWSGDEMIGETDGTGVGTGLNRLTESLGSEAVKRIKEFFGLLTNTREELEHTLHRG
jgi:hypothetical protein